MGEIGDAAVRRDPRDDLLERRELVVRDDRVGLDPEREHVGVVFRPTAVAFSSADGITSSFRVERSTVRTQWSVIASTS